MGPATSGASETLACQTSHLSQPSTLKSQVPLLQQLNYRDGGALLCLSFPSCLRMISLSPSRENPPTKMVTSQGSVAGRGGKAVEKYWGCLSPQHSQVAVLGTSSCRALSQERGLGSREAGFQQSCDDIPVGIAWTCKVRFALHWSHAAPDPGIRGKAW